MGIKEFFGGGSDKGLDCETDEQGNKVCRIMIRHKNNKFSTGSEFSFNLDNNCRSHINGKYSVFTDDEDLVKKALRQAESDCRGGDSIN